MNLYFDLMTSLEKAKEPVNSFLSASVATEFEKFQFKTRPEFIFSPSNFKDFFNGRSFIQGARGYYSFFRMPKSETVVFLMPSPFDLPLYFIARFKRLNIVCCVHDLTAHLGEAWPSARAIRARTRRASSLVAFSSPIAKSLEELEAKEVNLVSLPNTIPLLGSLGEAAQSLIHSMKTSPKTTVLLIGRIYAYKNAELIGQIASKSADFLFCIAGQLNLPIEWTQNLLILDKWLSNIEFDSILKESDIIIFPYSEASQSGTIPLAIAHQKIIVAADHPGFIDQLKNYDDKVIFERESEHSLILALFEARKKLSRGELVHNGMSKAPKGDSDLASLLLERIKKS